MEKEIFHFMGHSGLNFSAINMRFLQIVGHEAVYKFTTYKISWKIVDSTSESFYSVKNSSCILDQLGLNFNAIYLKLSQIVDHKGVYNI